jgi:ubiquinone/menaquinone biosynthesis C-methylase UbiE
MKRGVIMAYSPKTIRKSYDAIAEEEDRQEKKASLRVELPREFIKNYIKKTDSVLDAGGGTGINAIMMARRCRKVTLLDISPRILDLARSNIQKAGLGKKVDVLEGDITNLKQFRNGEFSFVVCVGDSISYVLDKRFKALKELVRVAKKGAILVIGCDSKYGFMRYYLEKGNLSEAIKINKTGNTHCGMGPKTHVYSVGEMTLLLEKNGCKVLEVASTPTFSDTLPKQVKKKYMQNGWQRLKKLEMEMCTKPELLGMGHHLLFIARKK